MIKGELSVLGSLWVRHISLFFRCNFSAISDQSCDSKWPAEARQIDLRPRLVEYIKSEMLLASSKTLFPVVLNRTKLLPMWTPSSWLQFYTNPHLWYKNYHHHPSTVIRQLNSDLKGCVDVKQPLLRKGCRRKWNYCTRKCKIALFSHM